MFFSLTIVLTEVLRSPLMSGRTDVLRLLILDASFKFIVVIGAWLVMSCAFLVFVRTPSHELNAILTLYYFGALNVLAHACQLTWWSVRPRIIQCGREDLWCRISRNELLPQMLSDTLLYSSLGLMVIWVGFCWTAYAEANEISIVKLIAVTVLASLLGLPLAVVGLNMRNAILY
jgi:hypothetical protein